MKIFGHEIDEDDEDDYDDLEVAGEDLDVNLENLMLQNTNYKVLRESEILYLQPPGPGPIRMSLCFSMLQSQGILANTGCLKKKATFFLYLE